MLIINRRVGQRIVLSGGIEITVGSVSRKGVRLALVVPRGIAVLRGEVYDEVVAANAAAAAAAASAAFGDSIDPESVTLSPELELPAQGEGPSAVEPHGKKVP